MAENEIRADVEVGTPSWSPVHARIGAGFSRRWNSRSSEMVDQVIEELGSVEALEAALRQSEELDTLMLRAVRAAAETAYADKRRLLARAVSQAAIDDARIDDAVLVVEMVSELEAVHVRSLERISSAEDAARAAGDLGPVAYGAEKPLTPQVSKAIEEVPVIVLRKLLSLGLVEASINWDGRTHANGTTSTGQDLLESLRAVRDEDA